MKRKTERQLKLKASLDTWLDLSNRGLSLWLKARPQGTSAQELADARGWPLHSATYRLEYLRSIGRGHFSAGLWYS